LNSGTHHSNGKNILRALMHESIYKKHFEISENIKLNQNNKYFSKSILFIKQLIFKTLQMIFWRPRILSLLGH
jgi:hypothetical protein